MTDIYLVGGMTCEGCSRSVAKAVDDGGLNYGGPA